MQLQHLAEGVADLPLGLDLVCRCVLHAAQETEVLPTVVADDVEASSFVHRVHSYHHGLATMQLLSTTRVVRQHPLHQLQVFLVQRLLIHIAPQYVLTILLECHSVFVDLATEVDRLSSRVSFPHDRTLFASRLRPLHSLGQRLDQSLADFGHGCRALGDQLQRQTPQSVVSAGVNVVPTLSFLDLLQMSQLLVLHLIPTSRPSGLHLHQAAPTRASTLANGADEGGSSKGESEIN
mmetsp:Transcript_2044/g.5908  ORF Transcript_2044/g.5908 Transcript_2044/m.5908 type:complete len:236 (-) Transcript_2044:17-724(-)